jgi:hypothetical protein
MNTSPETIPIQRYIAIDIYKHYVMIGAMDQQRQWTLKHERTTPHLASFAFLVSFLTHFYPPFPFLLHQPWSGKEAAFPPPPPLRTGRDVG